MKNKWENVELLFFKDSFLNELFDVTGLALYNKSCDDIWMPARLQVAGGVDGLKRNLTTTKE